MLAAVPVPGVPRRTVAVLSTMALLAAALVSGIVPAKAAAPTELFLSEYIEGSSNNKALEIYNGTAAPVDLAAGGYSVQMFFNGNPVSTLTINLTGTVAAGDVFVLAQSAANSTILALADQTNGSGWFNGDDAIVLRHGTSVVDSIGQVGADPGTEWGSGLTSTADNTLHRKPSVLTGDTNPSDAFDPAAEWDGFASDTTSGLGSHQIDSGGDAAPSVATTSPAANAFNIPTQPTITVTFSEPVNAGARAFTMSCAASGSHSLTVSDGPTTFTLTTQDVLAGYDNCTVTVHGAEVTDVDTDDGADAMTSDYSFTFTTVAPTQGCDESYTHAYTIQGTGNSSPLVGKRVAVKGVVVADYEGAQSQALRGYYLQDLSGDGDSASSDAIFVFNNSTASNVSPGQVVWLTGTVSEFAGQTQITALTTPLACGAGSVPRAGVDLPVASPTFLERYEGMLVGFDQELSVTETFQLGRYGQIVMSSGGRLYTPTQLAAPGADARALQAQNNLNRIIVDDDRQDQNRAVIAFGRGGAPLSASNTLRIGDTATDVHGILTQSRPGTSSFDPSTYRVRTLSASSPDVPTFRASNPRPEVPADVGGSMKVASFNVLNYFNTFNDPITPGDDCSFGVDGDPSDCRGAESTFEFDRQADKIVDALTELDADVVGLIEIENDGYGPGSAIQDLVNRVNAEVPTEDAYTVLDLDYLTGQKNVAGTDAIKVGFIYRERAVSAIGETAVLNTGAFGLFVVQGEDEPIGRSRPAVAQTFLDKTTGGRVTVSVNHLKSKGSSCASNVSPVAPDPDTGDGQGNCNLTRTAATDQLVDWLATRPTKVNESDRLIIGDLNAYAMEDPVTTITAAGYTNMIKAELGNDAYSYVFDGQSGYLDHALASPSLVDQVTGVIEWHINADEPTVLDYNTNFKPPSQYDSLYAADPYRSSDHDPVLIGLNLRPQGDRSSR